jgi:hypothetical protein
VPLLWLCIQDLSGEDFENLTLILMETKVLDSVSGQQTLVDVIAEILEFDKSFDASEAENFEKLLMLSKYALENITVISLIQGLVVVFIVFIWEENDDNFVGSDYSRK